MRNASVSRANSTWPVGLRLDFQSGKCSPESRGSHVGGELSSAHSSILHTIAHNQTSKAVLSSPINKMSIYFHHGLDHPKQVGGCSILKPALTKFCSVVWLLPLQLSGLCLALSIHLDLPGFLIKTNHLQD